MSLSEIKSKINELSERKKELEKHQLQLALEDGDISTTKRLQALFNGFKAYGVEKHSFSQVFGIMEAKGHSDDEIEEVIEKLKREGELFEPEQGYIQKI